MYCVKVGMRSHLHALKQGSQVILTHSKHLGGTAAQLPDDKTHLFSRLRPCDLIQSSGMECGNLYFQQVPQVILTRKAGDTLP